MNTKRTYASALRDEQAQLTREKILATAAALVTGGVDGVTMQSVAKASGVALRTVFRHFPTREDLLDATWNRLNAQLGETPELASGAALAAFLPELFARYGAIEDQIRAVMFSSLMQPSRRRQGSDRRRKVMAALERAIDTGDARADAKARSAAYLLTIPTAMLFLKDNYGLSTEEAAEAAAWAVEALIAAAKTQPPRSAE